MVTTPVLIVGAGPFGLALAAEARAQGVEHLIVGNPMEFWRTCMPAQLLLRSDCEWHLDPAERHTIDAFLAETGRTRKDVEPLALAFYLEYVEWFAQRAGVQAMPARVTRLARAGAGFHATLADGSTIEAERVVLALGMGYFAHVPAELAALLPDGSYVHTRDYVNFDDAEGKRFLIVGGRQSAFEWAALLREHGAAAVHLSYRHDTPAFVLSHWDWAAELAEQTDAEPGWFRARTDAERQAIVERMFQEGRRQLEPWLLPRIAGDVVTMHPHTHVVDALGTGAAHVVRLSDGTEIEVDRIVLATGYRVDVARIPFLDAELRSEIAQRNGYPVLDVHFMTTAPGLYMTSMAAAQDFGPFFAFTGSVRPSARVIVRGLKEQS